VWLPQLQCACTSLLGLPLLSVGVPMPESMGLSLKEKRAIMAAKFEKTQRGMATAVDDLRGARRSVVPYASTWQGESISEHGPIPTDRHLIPSTQVIETSGPSIFKSIGSQGSPLHLSDKPWATYHKPEPVVFEKPFAGSSFEAPSKPKVAIDEEMWRTRYQEWTLQKNAFNPDIAAAMRTNVRKQAALSVVDPALAVDPARTSENVKAALSSSESTGPAYLPPKSKLGLGDYLPTH